MNSLKSILQTMFVCFLIITTQLFSATITIKGKVVDENNNPISEVNIYSSTIGTESETNGTFMLAVDNGSVVSFSHIGYNDISISAEMLTSIVQMNSTMINGKEIIVNAEFGNQKLYDTPSSISIINNRELEFRNENHFQNIIGAIPNLNYSGGTSRPRYFQIRGIGERSQYAGEGAPNFSVGYMVDGIDFSGIGMAGMLFDAQQIEVFKGPQSSIYGPNAMAGLINITSAEPTPFYTAKSLLSIGSDNLQTYGLAFGGPLFSNLTYRLALQKHSQNGFRENTYQHKTSTNKRDELFTRTKLNWTISKNINLSVVSFTANLNNGYDAWAVDNNIDYITYSDQQGMDSQNSEATSIKLNFSDETAENAFYQYTTSTNEMEHSYDGDWANNDFWLEEPYDFDPDITGWEYSFYDKAVRNRNKNTHEIRFSKVFSDKFAMTFGSYSSSTTESDVAEGWLFGGEATSMISDFTISNLSAYTQIKYTLLDNLKIITNIRSEQVETDYVSSGLNWDWDAYDYISIPVVAKNVNHSFVGGKLAVIYNLMTSTELFTSISRGYKAGGVNQNPYLSDDSRFYEPEYNTNFEIGMKTIEDNFTSNITFFAMQRTDQQVQISSQQDDGNPNSFYFYTSNAATGTNIGAEFDAKAKLESGLTARFSLGLLKTFVDEYEFWEDEETMAKLGDREQAMAPLYNFSFGVNYRHSSGVFADVEFTGKDEYYFSDSHNQRSDAYQLLNLTTGYSNDKWTISLWGKNIMDIRYATRGFYFGNEPIWNSDISDHEYPDKLYLSYGDPLHYGMIVKYQF